MYCRKCGSQINDSALFCAKCGERTTVAETSNLEKKKINKKKIFIPILIAVASIVLIVTIILVAVGGDGYKDGYEGAVQRFIDCCILGETDEENIRDMAPLAYLRSWADLENDGDMEEMFRRFKEEGEETKKERKEEYADFNVDYEIYDAAKLSSNECQRVEKALEYYRDKRFINYGEITDGYSFELVLTYTTIDFDGNKDIDYDEGNVVAVKIDGKWYLATYTSSRIIWMLDAAF